MAVPSSSQIETEIKNILDGADLSTLSSKKVRRLLEGTFNMDLTSRKKEVDKVLMEQLAKKEKDEKEKEEENDTKKEEEEKDVKQEEETDKDDVQSTEAQDGSQSDSSFETPEDMSPPESKKQKVTKQEVIDDEELARRLQEEDSGRRATRHCSKQKHVQKKAKKSKKTKSEKPRKGVKTGYNSDMVLSAELAEIMGTERMSRSEVVKRMWQIIKERQLADPKNKQYHICDDQLLKVFGIKRVRTFSMMKYLKRHIKDPDLLSDS